MAIRIRVYPQYANPGIRDMYEGAYRKFGPREEHVEWRPWDFDPSSHRYEKRMRRRTNRAINRHQRQLLAIQRHRLAQLAAFAGMQAMMPAMYPVMPGMMGTPLGFRGAMVGPGFIYDNSRC